MSCAAHAAAARVRGFSAEERARIADAARATGAFSDEAIVDAYVAGLLPDAARAAISEEIDALKQERDELERPRPDRRQKCWLLIGNRVAKSWWEEDRDHVEQWLGGNVLLEERDAAHRLRRRIARERLEELAETMNAKVTVTCGDLKQGFYLVLNLGTGIVDVQRIDRLGHVAGTVQFYRREDAERALKQISREGIDPLHLF